MKTFIVHFPEDPPVTLEVGSHLSECLTATNSPLLFGCRTGICATCLCQVDGEVEPPDEDELEVLEIWADGDPKARLACQLKCTGDIHIRPHPEAP